MAKRKDHDSVIIYRSKEDGCWIAHSLKMDQIGTGDRIVDALADVMKAIKLISEEAEKDPTLQVMRDAPKEIRDRARKAKALPREIYEVAYKMVHGTWPEDWNPPEPRDSNMTFKAEVQELAS